MAREGRGCSLNTETPDHYSARGVNLSSYTLIIGDRNTQVKIT
jgi:hypothetical protein